MEKADRQGEREENENSQKILRFKGWGERKKNLYLHSLHSFRTRDLAQPA